MKYIRLRDRILNERGTLVRTFPSISQARKHSRYLQSKGHQVRVDHSEDPQPTPLNLGKKNPKYQYVSRAEERKISAINKREERERVEKTRRMLGLSSSQRGKVGS